MAMEKLFLYLLHVLDSHGNDKGISNADERDSKVASISRVRVEERKCRRREESQHSQDHQGATQDTLGIHGDITTLRYYT